MCVQVRLDLAGVGLSVVTGGREQLYGRVTGIRLRAAASQARRTLELALHSVQVSYSAQHVSSRRHAALAVTVIQSERITAASSNTARAPQARIVLAHVGNQAGRMPPVRQSPPGNAASLHHWTGCQLPSRQLACPR